MNELVFLEHDITKEPFTTSKVIAETTGIRHDKVKNSIDNNKVALETFGKLTPYGVSLGGRGNEAGYHLTEPQATLLITFLKNTPVVVAFKTELVRQFYLMKTEVIRSRTIRELGKPATRDLADAVHEHFTDPWAFKRFQDLAYKKALGQTAAQIRKERGAAKTATANDFLTADELARVNKTRSQLAVLVDMGMDYDVIKALVMNSGCAISVGERS